MCNTYAFTHLSKAYLYITRFPGAGALGKILSPESGQSPPFEHFWCNINILSKYLHQFVEILIFFEMLTSIYRNIDMFLKY